MKTVLLIDDDRSLRDILGQWLSGSGWRVLEAEDGEVGLQLAFEHRPDVVVCDLLMPRCNGFQVCRSIRQHRDRLPNTKVIVTTGSGYATDRLNAFEAGADEYLVKPVAPSELIRLIDKVTEQASGADTTSPTIASANSVKLRFWGVRGSVPSPGPATVFYGGNTSCVEVRADGEIIILDAGTGIRQLGLALQEEFESRKLNLTVLITHTHWDHIQGFPFFLPAYDQKNQLRIIGYEGARRGLENTLSGQMEVPYFPISMHQMPGNIVIEEMKEREFSVGAVKVKAERLEHPGICNGYRLSTSAGSIAYLPDVELFKRLRTQVGTTEGQDEMREKDRALIEFIRGVDVLILDSQYDAAEYEQHVGWGHSCVEDSVALALKADVKRLFLFHHDPAHDDGKISRLVARARELVSRHRGTLIVDAAREGLELTLDGSGKVSIAAPSSPATAVALL